MVREPPRRPAPSTRVFASAALRIGRFAIAPDDVEFAHAGAIGAWPEVVFPGTAVVIAQAGRAAFVADANVAVLYNAGQEYERRPVDPRGDRCHWVAVRPELLAALPALAAGDRPEAPFTRGHTWCDARTYALQALLLGQVAATQGAEPLAVEETTLRLLGRVFGGEELPGGEPPARWRELVESARAAMARDLDQPLALDALARMLGVGPFHLCRVFRRLTGSTLADYRRQLRLRAALQRLPEARGDLSALALDVGFASHSHFTAWFRRCFGFPPQRLWSDGSGRLAARLAAG